MADRALRCLAVVLLVACAPAATSSRQAAVDSTALARGSGGPLTAEQASYDVLYYDLDVRVDPGARTIAGTLTMVARVLRPLASIVLDLDEAMVVESVSELRIGGPPAAPPALRFERRGGRIWVAAGRTLEQGELAMVAVKYAGAPRVAPNPPWSGGFVWSKTVDGRPWIGVACQMDGADLWWPCKDHPSDEPEAMALHVTVPDGLVCAANGKQGGVRMNSDGTRTFDWFVSTPVNNYGISLNIAPYEELKADYRSVGGQTVPVRFWVLPEHADQGRRLLGEFQDYVTFLERLLGPYPFRADKIGIAETPYLGMEHQSIIAYGHDFTNNDAGFDWLLFHEFGHEWWANLVTAPDWNDFWIHEGFTSYTDVLYAEHKLGEKALRARIAGMQKATINAKPLAPREPRTTVQMYFVGGDPTKSDGDIYSKGAAVLDTLRYLIGDKPFFKAFRTMAYPTPSLERATDGSQCRFATTEDFRRIAEQSAGVDLGWFFEVYVRRAPLPRLVQERVANGVRLRWDVPDGLPFPMPVDVRVGGTTRRVTVPAGGVVVRGMGVVVDPDSKVLKGREAMAAAGR